MYSDMTRITKESYEKAISPSLGIQEAVDFLEREARQRSLRDKLEKFAKGRDLKTLLVEGLADHNPEMKRDSIERKVRGWLKPDGERSVKKRDAIELCFILQLDVEEADQLVAMVSEERLHWRNPDEIILIFALQNGLDYHQTLALEERLAGLLPDVSEEAEPSEDSFTGIIRSEVSELGTEEELEAYLRHAAGRLGYCHNNAYQLFIDMMDTLENPAADTGEAELFEEEHLTVRDILREYLYADNVLSAKERARKTKKGKTDGKEAFILSKIQKSIASSWPDETTISKMKSRQMDVTRKILILLFLATDAGWQGDEEDEYVPTTAEAFEDLYSRLDNMLTLCGFSVLDPRAPFDWLILYCICVPDMLDVDARMHEIFREMFGEDDEISF